jgi:hypothetical protein
MLLLLLFINTMAQQYCRSNSYLYPDHNNEVTVEPMKGRATVLIDKMADHERPGTDDSMAGMDNEPPSALLACKHHRQDEQIRRRQRQPVQAQVEPHPLIRSLSLLDPVLQFLTRASGQTSAPLSSLHATIPTLSRKIPWEHVLSLIRYGIVRADVSNGVRRDGADDPPGGNPTATPSACVDEGELQAQWTGKCCDESTSTPSSAAASSTPTSSPTSPIICLGFPSNEVDKSLCGSTKTAAKRRLAALKRHIKKEGGRKSTTATTTTTTPMTTRTATR